MISPLRKNDILQLLKLFTVFCTASPLTVILCFNIAMSSSSPPTYHFGGFLMTCHSWQGGVLIQQMLPFSSSKKNNIESKAFWVICTTGSAAMGRKPKTFSTQPCHRCLQWKCITWLRVPYFLQELEAVWGQNWNCGPIPPVAEPILPKTTSDYISCRSNVKFWVKLSPNNNHSSDGPHRL